MKLVEWLANKANSRWVDAGCCGSEERGFRQGYMQGFREARIMAAEKAHKRKAFEVAKEICNLGEEELSR